jgi:cytidylate kinase
VTLVALSASYGAGGSRVGPALAQRLGVPFVDRAIPTAVAEQLSVPFDEAVAHDEQSAPSFIERMLGGFLGSDTGAPTPLPAQAMSGEDFRRATEEVLCRQAETGEGVILGRGGAVVLRDHPRALRVRLDGPVELRVQQAVRLQGVDLETARQTVRRLDRAHAAYLKQFYGVDIDDPTLYHLRIDSTAMPLETCVELIVVAASALTPSA